MGDCLFCNIVVGKIPAYKVYEDDIFLAFLDVHPSSFGHTMVVPKKHVSTMFDLKTDELGELYKKVCEIALAIKNSEIKATGFNIGVNHWKTAGQEIEHLHVHIIPRFEGDGGGAIQSIVKSESKDSLENTAEKIRSQIG
ncbi:MAG TPA: HIT family protein [bacterium]|nr:HIT family protein [bacterium]